MTMKWEVFIAVSFIGLVSADSDNGNTAKEPIRLFPKDFKFGVSTSAYQHEGGWNEDGKGWSVWDHLTHTDPGSIEDGSNADVAADSYHLYKRDVEIMGDLGLNSYKFSVSWPRVLPIGLPSYVNPKGIAYYNALIDELLAKGIEPFVALYHWDLPQYLQDRGGLLSDEFPTWFGEYARVVFQNFGDRVKHWITLNEPLVHCLLSFELDEFMHAPRVHLPGRGFYNCNRNLLLAHAKAYHIYDEEFRPTQNGTIGISVFSDWPIASTNSSDDAEAVLDYLALRVDMYMNPIFSKKGNYPQRAIDNVALRSSEQGLKQSRLPPFTNEEVNYVRGTSDYLALNHYNTDFVYKNASLFEQIKTVGSPAVRDDFQFGLYKDLDWRLRTSAEPWRWDYAPGFYNILLYIQKKYNNPPTYILENGFSTGDGLRDDIRVHFLRNYLSALQNALDAGVNVKGYFHWSLMDHFEWHVGYIKKFGLYEVDMNDPLRPRIARKSALVYKEIIRTRSIDYSYDPDPILDDLFYTVTKHTLICVAISVVLFARPNIVIFGFRHIRRLYGLVFNRIFG